MDKSLMFLQSCVRQGVSVDDLGYLCKLVLYHADVKPFEEVVTEVEVRLNVGFYHNPKKIRSILEFYKQQNT